MRFADFVIQTLRPIRSKKLESALIVLAIAFGVGMITGFSSLIRLSATHTQQARQKLQYRELRLESSGHEAEANRTFYSSQAISELLPVAKALPRISVDIATEIKQQTPAIEYAYLAEEELLDSRSDAPEGFVNFVRSTLEYPRAAKLKLLSGSWFGQKDIDTKANLIIVSNEYARHIFKNEDVIGKTLRNYRANLSQVELMIVGVFAVPEHSVYWSDSNRDGIAGIAPYRGDLTPGKIDLGAFRFVAKVGAFEQARGELLDAAQRRWGKHLNIYSRISELQRDQQNSNSLMTIVMLFTSLGLLIASLNVTNLMMARVKSRTRQIGIIGALGASKKMVYWLYLGESIMLGVLGSLGGLIVALVVVVLANSTSRGGEYSFQIGLPEVALCIGLSVVLAMIFGMVPAMVAARQNITLALRR